MYHRILHIAIVSTVGSNLPEKSLENPKKIEKTSEFCVMLGINKYIYTYNITALNIIFLSSILRFLALRWNSDLIILLRKISYLPLSLIEQLVDFQKSAVKFSMPAIKTQLFCFFLDIFNFDKKKISRIFDFRRRL